jgi:hypothetical protein
MLHMHDSRALIRRIGMKCKVTCLTRLQLKHLRPPQGHLVRRMQCTFVWLQTHYSWSIDLKAL